MWKRAVSLAALLSLCAWYSVRAGSSGAALKFERVDKGLMLFRPMYAPVIGMELRSGPKRMERGDVVICHQSNEHTTAISKEDGGEVGIYEFIMTCGDQVYVVKGVRFEEN